MPGILSSRSRDLNLQYDYSHSILLIDIEFIFAGVRNFELSTTSLMNE